MAVEVSPGKTGDPATVEKLQRRLHLHQVLLVGDRRVLPELWQEQDVGWITALRSHQIRKPGEGGSLHLGLFDERNLAEIADPECPGERLVVCRNPLLATERARKWEALLWPAAEAELRAVVARVNRASCRPVVRSGWRWAR